MKFPAPNGWAGWLVAAGVCVLLGVSQCRTRDASAKAAVWEERAKVAEREADRLRDAAPRLDTVYRQATAAAGVSAARYTAVRDSLRRALASGFRPKESGGTQSARVPPDSASAPLDTALVGRALAAGDSALAACSVVVRACEAQRDTARAEAASLRAALAARRELRDAERCRILLIPCPSRTVSLVAGVVLGAVGVGALGRR